MITISTYDEREKEFTNTLHWHDDNSAKAFMFDILYNPYSEFADGCEYVSIETIEPDEEYIIHYQLKNKVY